MALGLTNRIFPQIGRLVVESYGNDGGGGVPAGATAVSTATISAALTAATAGQTLYLAPGDYSSFLSSLSGINKGSGTGVVLQGSVLGGVTTNTIHASNCVGLHFSYITVDNSGGSVTASINFDNGSSYCTADHISVRGGVSVRSQAVQMRLVTFCSVTHCDFWQVGEGINAGGGQGGVDLPALCHDITIAYNRVQKYITDGMLIQNVGWNLWVHDNLVWWQDIDVGDHDDTLQISACGSATTKGLYDAATGRYWSVIIERNNAQILGQDNQAAAINGAPFTDYSSAMLIRNNVCFGASTNGIQVRGGTDVLVTQNFTQGVTGATWGSATPISIRSQADNVTVTNNSTSQGITNSVDPVNQVQLGADPLSVVNGSPIVTVAHTAHGFSTGFSVQIFGATALGGFDPRGTYTITVLDANTYTYNRGGNANATTSGGGTNVSDAQMLGNTNVTISGNTVIALATSYTDTALRDAFIAQYSLPKGFNALTHA